MLQPSVDLFTIERNLIMTKQKKSKKKSTKKSVVAGTIKSSPRKTDEQRIEKQLKTRALRFASAGTKVETAEEAILADES